MPRIIAGNIQEAALDGEQLPFPIDALPAVLGDMARAIFETTGSPLDICGPCVLATASACLGAGVLVNGAPGRETGSNIYVMVIKPSGSGGSVAYNHATAPLRGYQALAMREFEKVTKPQLERRRDTLQADYEETGKARRKLRAESASLNEIQKKEAELDALRLEMAGVEAELCPPFITVSDTTPESLAALLQKRGEVLAHFDSDANDTIGAILGIRYGNGQHTNESLHLKAYSGESFAITRKGTVRGGSVELFLNRPTLTCLFVVTPDAARKLVSSERMVAGGLLARFLVVKSQAKPQLWIARGQIPPQVSQRYEAAAFALLTRFRDLPADPLAAIEMTSEAWDLFSARWKSYCDNFDPEYSAFEARQTENAIRIALILHVWKRVQFGEGTKVVGLELDDVPLSGSTAREALEIARWFEIHQTQLLAPIKDAAQDEKFEKAWLLCQRRREWVISARDLVTYRISSNADEADQLLARWETMGQATRVAIENKGGPGPRQTKQRFKLRAPK